MPSKSRRGRGKHSLQSKKRQGDLAGVAQQRVVTDKLAVPGVPASSPGVSAPIATLTGARYSHVAAELRRIGILAGIMLAILVVLALVLS